MVHAPIWFLIVFLFICFKVFQVFIKNMTQKLFTRQYSNSLKKNLFLFLKNKAKKNGKTTCILKLMYNKAPIINQFNPKIKDGRSRSQECRWNRRKKVKMRGPWILWLKLSTSKLCSNDRLQDLRKARWVLDPLNNIDIIILIKTSERKPNGGCNQDEGHSNNDEFYVTNE